MSVATFGIRPTYFLGCHGSTDSVTAVGQPSIGQFLNGGLTAVAVLPAPCSGGGDSLADLIDPCTSIVEGTKPALELAALAVIAGGASDDGHEANPAPVSSRRIGSSCAGQVGHANPTISPSRSMGVHPALTLPRRMPHDGHALRALAGTAWRLPPLILCLVISFSPAGLVSCPSVRFS